MKGSNRQPNTFSGGRTSVAASESLAIESAAASPVVENYSKTSTTEKPYISTHG